MRMSEEQTQPGSTGLAADIHVLLVDDDGAFLDLIYAMKTSIGIAHVTRAASGREAFEKL